MALGITIDLYLMDGTASGRCQAKLSNWNAIVYRIPHSEIKNSEDLEYINSPGVYLLFGKDDETQRKFIYIGEADDVQKRLLQPHTFEKDDSYWTEAVIFVTSDGTLNKGHVKYLENRLYTIAKSAQRYIIKNCNTPKQSTVTKQDKDKLEMFILNARLVLPALGYLVFEDSPSDVNTNKDDDLLYLTFKENGDKKAIGKMSSEGFWVLKGSCIRSDYVRSIPEGVLKLRNEYSDKIKNNTLTVDICFGSPSYAADFVLGRSENGLLAWENKDGIKLKDLYTDDNTTVTSGNKKKVKSESKKANKIKQEIELLYLSRKNIKATGYKTENGFVVCKGSGFAKIETNSCQDYIRNRRKKLIEEGKIKNYKFREDVLFTSSTTAGACVTGASVNGNDVWKK